MNKEDIFLSRIDESLSIELLTGAKIIYSFLLKNKGYVLIERETPIINKSNNMPYKWASYEYNSSIEKFYCACEFLYQKGVNTTTIINRAHNKFYDR